MKIVHISYTHRYDDIRIYEKECRSLKKEGYDVTHIASNKIAELPKNIDLEIPVKIIRLKKSNRIGVVWKYLNEVVKEVDLIRPDICHLHDWQLMPLIFMLRKKYKIIFDSHEDYPAYLSTDFSKHLPQGLKKWVIFNIEKIFLKRATYLIGATHYIELQLRKITKHVISVKNYPIIFKNYAENYYEPQFCYIGGMGDNLGGKQISRALQGLDTKLLLVGKTPEEYVKEMNDLSDQRVEDCGFKTKKEVREIIKESRAGIVVYLPHPNCVHALPNKMFEYLEAEVPIICSDFKDWKKILGEKDCCKFVNPYDIKGINKAMRFFLENPEEARRMGKNGRRAIEDEFNWNKEEVKLLSLYKKIASES